MMAAMADSRSAQDGKKQRYVNAIVQITLKAAIHCGFYCFDELMPTQMSLVVE